LEGPKGEQIDDKNVMFTRKLLDFDAVIIAGQAKSHCVAWTIDDLLNEIYISDRKLTEKVYLLEDCTSPVVIPDVIDYTEPADEAFKKFADAGMHIVCSTDPIVNWPGMQP
jgi:nicotinamidase-related amidase